MAKIQLLVGSTSNTINVFIQDSSSTVGAGLGGLVYNSSGLTAYYALPRAAPVAITLATQTVTGAFSSGGFVELDATHTKGLYRLDIPDAAVASGRFANIYLYGATNMAPVVLEIELTAWNNQDAVHGGMSALPNAAASAAGGLPVSTAGGLDLDEMNVDIEAIQAKTDNLPASPASTTNITAGTIATVTNLTNAPTVGDLTAAMAATVKAQVVAALNTDTYAEPGQGAPAATTTLAAKLNYLFKWMRNKCDSDGSTTQFYDSAGTTVDQKRTTSVSGGVVTKGTISSGP